ncbi:MAG: right-handed parallel beta-helix repeat-containing protein [Verrucomicrobiales bacterium]|nr:right-handed parallel beta-helix repeat-containing protein [Verrucomicrobiales bacterium]
MSRSPSACPNHTPQLLDTLRRAILPHSPLWRFVATAAALLYFTAPSRGATFRWANSSNRIYVEGGGIATLSDIKAALPTAPLDLVNATTKIWLLRADLIVEDGSILHLHGDDAGGDVNELRLLSRNSAAPGSVVLVDADWGTLDLQSVKVTSWDDTLGGPDTESDLFRRAALRARSRLVGSTPQESTLNVINSEIAYLGYNSKEQYALTWQVVGNPPGVHALGVVTNSHLHHSKLGVGSWSAQDVTWESSELDANTLYGFAPEDPAQQAVLAANNVHDNLLGASLRWAPAGAFIYVTGPGTATLSDIRNALPEAPLDLVDPLAGTWLLRAKVEIEDGATLHLHGTAAGGEVNELRLLSRNSDLPGSVVSIDADWGTLDLQSVKVTSWDDVAGGPDTEYLTYQRAFLRARSRLVGSTPQESTLNVINSEISHLGYNFREGFSLTLQVVLEPPSVRVLGLIQNSSIHDSLVDVSSWGSPDAVWSGNEIAASTLFGFQPSLPAFQATLAANNIHDVTYGATFRWAESVQRLYVMGPGTATLSDLRSGAPEAPLQLVDAAHRIWLLRCDLQVEEDAHLHLHGSTLGGDVDELRLLSNNTADPHAFVWISADYGTLDIRNTRITSWDEAVGGPDTEYASFGRAWIRARSSLGPDGLTPLESRMDIIESDVGYLGYHGSEAYGLVWKVTGVHPDPEQDIFDHVNVYGDILNSRLHHNYFGMYSFGHQGGQWMGNEVDHNVGYGFDPHDDSDHLLIEDNDVHHNGLHGIIASKRCDHLVIRNNRVWANAKNGIMLHRSCDDSVIEDNVSFSNADAGIALFGTWRVQVRHNLVLSNFNAGIRISVGGGNHAIVHNEIGHSGKNGALFLYRGTDLPEPGDDGRPRNLLIASNLIHHLAAEAVKHQDSDQVTYLANTIVDDAPLLRFQTSANVVVVSNAISSNAVTKIVGSPTVYTDVRFIAQNAFEVNVNTTCEAIFEDPDGAIFNVDEAPGSTTAASSTTGSPSSISLTAPPVGTFTHIVRVPLFALSAETALLINPTLWSTVPSEPREWTLQTASGTLPIEFTVEALQPSFLHKLYLDGVSMGYFTSDPAGALSMEVTPGTPGLHELRLVPQL